METIHRTFQIDDMEASASRREIVAYAAVFNRAAEVRDHQGHYNEVIAPTAFQRTLNSLGDNITRVKVLFNHGRDLAGRPTSRFAMPIGVPTEIVADGRGLRTVTRISATPLGDQVLELARDGAVTGYSFTGGALQSTKTPPLGDGLPTVTRTEIRLLEYGPGVFPVYEDAAILAVRTISDLAEDLTGLDVEGRAELARLLTATTPADQRPVDGPNDPSAGPALDGIQQAQRKALLKLHGVVK